MKKIILVMIIIMFFISNIKVYAFENIENLQLEKERNCESLLTYKNKIIKTSYIKTKIGEKEYPCYCINPELDGVGELGSYSVNVEKNIEKDSLIYKAIINGYPYKSLEELGVHTIDEAYTATKQAIYSMIYGRYKDMSNYGKVNSEAGERTLNALNKIVENTLKTKIEDEFTKIEEISKWEIKGDRCSKEYKLISNNIKEYDVEIQGNVPEDLEVKKQENTFEISIPINEMLESVDFLINIKYKNESKPVLYGKTLKENSQNYAIAGIKFEDAYMEYEDSYDKNNTMLKLIKVDKETGETLEGVKFKIYNNKKEILIDNLVTNKEGEIILENFLPGEYYLEEIQALDGYEIHKELIEIEVEYNKENIVNITNIKKEIPEKSDIPKLPKTGF